MKQYYLDVLCPLRDTICRLWASRYRHLHQDKAPVHSSAMIQSILAKNGIPVGLLRFLVSTGFSLKANRHWKAPTSTSRTTRWQRWKHLRKTFSRHASRNYRIVGFSVWKLQGLISKIIKKMKNTRSSFIFLVYGRILFGQILYLNHTKFAHEISTRLVLFHTLHAYLCAPELS